MSVAVAVKAAADLAATLPHDDPLGRLAWSRLAQAVQDEENAHGS